MTKHYQRKEPFLKHFVQILEPILASKFQVINMVLERVYKGNWNIVEPLVDLK